MFTTSWAASSELVLNAFSAALRQKDFVVTAEPVLRPDTTSTMLRDIVACLGGSVDAIQIGNDRYADGPIATMAAASIVLNAGADVVFRVSCRDRNRLALQSELIGAAAIGVNSVLLERGRKLPVSLKGKIKGVFDTKSVSLIAMAKFVGESVADRPGANFTLGSSATIIGPGEGWRGSRLTKKIEAGATFLQTQPCLNSALVAKYMEGIVALKLTHQASIIVEIPLLDSVAAAKALKASDARAPLPQRLIKRIGQSTDPLVEGEKICGEMVSEVQKIAGVRGVNILFSGSAERARSVVDRVVRSK